MDLIITAVVLFFLGRALWHRIRTIRVRVKFEKRLREVCDRKGYRLTRYRNGFASFFSVGHEPDFSVKAKDKDYCVRFVTTLKRNRYYHFANEEYAASFTRLSYALPMAKKFEELELGDKFHHFPPIELPRELEGRDNVECVMLFNPVPIGISLAQNDTQEGGIVGNCGKIGRFTIYDGRSFCDLLEGKELLVRKKDRWSER